MYTPLAKFVIHLNGGKLGKRLKVNGIIRVRISPTGFLNIGNNCRINSGPKHNVSGGSQRNTFWSNGYLQIMDNVGISSSSFLCRYKIHIGNNVKIGGGCLFMDSDSHSQNPKERLNISTDKTNTLFKAIYVADNVFIGARCTILKGVTIGKNSIVGACSVVTKNIPENEIWAGNPAKFIKKIAE